MAERLQQKFVVAVRQHPDMHEQRRSVGQAKALARGNA
jgi:hypothetical protein